MKQKILLGKIHDTYQKRHGVDCQLKFKDRIVDKSDTIKSFLEADNDLVLFIACLTDHTRLEAQPAAPAEAALGACDIPLASSTFSDRRVKDEPGHDIVSMPQVREEMPLRSPLAVSSVSENVPTVSKTQEAMPSRPAASTLEVPVTIIQESPDARTIASTHGAMPSAPPDRVAVKHEHGPEPAFHHMDQETQMSFDPERYFNREPSPEQARQEDVKPTDRSIREIITRPDPQLLEAGVAQTMKVLQNLKQSFLRYAESPDARAWIEAINKLIPQAERKRTVRAALQSVCNIEPG